MKGYAEPITVDSISNWNRVYSCITHNKSIPTEILKNSGYDNIYDYIRYVRPKKPIRPIKKERINE